jgi:hypothetical protein
MSGFHGNPIDPQQISKRILVDSQWTPNSQRTPSRDPTDSNQFSVRRALLERQFGEMN